MKCYSLLVYRLPFLYLGISVWHCSVFPNVYFSKRFRPTEYNSVIGESMSNMIGIFTVVSYPHVCISVEVVTRGQWGAAAPQCRETLKYPAQRVIIHHTALHCGGIQECMDQLIHIQRMHMQDRNFDDIGYNFLIGGDCTVYEGRGWGVVGTHTKGNNHNSLAIAFMGNFNNESPSPAAKSSVKQLLQCGVSQGHFHPVFILLGHRDLRDTESGLPKLGPGN
uniref:Peptidoglycan recognition protein 5 n=1 Tax=Oncorhynchus kisutch TaxID=8019 RepID=A0A8C7J658_ONCKI